MFAIDLDFPIRTSNAFFFVVSIITLQLKKKRLKNRKKKKLLSVEEICSEEATAVVAVITKYWARIDTYLSRLCSLGIGIIPCTEFITLKK